MGSRATLYTYTRGDRRKQLLVVYVSSGETSAYTQPPHGWQLVGFLLLRVSGLSTGLLFNECRLVVIWVDRILVCSASGCCVTARCCSEEAPERGEDTNCVIVAYPRSRVMVCVCAAAVVVCHQHHRNNASQGNHGTTGT